MRTTTYRSAYGSTGRGFTQGFTLIELLVALVLLAVISAIAIPSYQTYAVGTYRAEAQADLLLCAQALERQAAVSFSYRGAADTDGDGVGDADQGTIASAICQPRSVGQSRYSFLVNGGVDTYTLTAVPQGGAMAGDGRMTLDNTGVRGWDRNGDNDTTDAGEDTWEE